MSAPSSAPLLQTPLIECHRRAAARLVPFAGWEMPVDYGSAVAEHHAVRDRVGMFDVSHMGQVRFTGRRAHQFLAHLVPGNTSRLLDGQSLYTTLCNLSGGIVDDLIVTRLDAMTAFLVVNAGTREKDIEWIERLRHEMGFIDVAMRDESADWAMIAVQGPAALAMLEVLLPGTEWTQTPAFTLHRATWNGTPLMVSRTGYTGEGGAEILLPSTIAADFWSFLETNDVRPCGLGARDTLRLEMGYPLYGQDLSETITPLEAGIGWTVSFRKTEAFVGRVALEHQKSHGVTRRRVGLVFDSRRPMRSGDRVLADGEDVGVVTSGGFSPKLGKGIGLALVSAGVAGRETLDVDSRSGPQTATVTKPPFVTVKSIPFLATP